jgi:hypothetical protein
MTSVRLAPERTASSTLRNISSMAESVAFLISEGNPLAPGIDGQKGQRFLLGGLDNRIHLKNNSLMAIMCMPHRLILW